MQPNSQEIEGYSARHVARLVDIPVSQIRAWIRAGLIHPGRGSRGEYRLSFRDVVFLRNARSVLNRVPLRRLNRGLRRLKEQMAETRELSEVRIRTEGSALVASDRNLTWNPESGQVPLEFDALGVESVTVTTFPVPPITERTPVASPELRPGGDMNAEEWYMAGCELEISDPDSARQAYLDALALDPGHVDARINLGRLLHEAGDLTGAEAQCRMALESCPGDVTAAFNLGVVLEDLNRPRDAVEAYRIAIAGDPAHVDAHYNLARLHETLGDRQSAIRHLDVFRKLIKGR